MEVDLLNKGREYIQEGKFEKVQIIVRRALRENPNEAMALELSGDLILKSGKAEDAIYPYEHASNSYTNSNQYAEAIICLEKIIKIDKSNSEIFTRLADLYRFYGLQNRSINTMLELCSWAIDNNKDAFFVSGLRKIVELQSKNLALGVSFAKILLSIGRTSEASDELNKLKSLAEEAGDENMLEEIEKLLLQPDGGEELDPKSRVELGNLLYEIGSKDEAIVEFEKAVSDLIESGETNEAINVLNRIVEIDPDNTSAIDKIKELKEETEKEEPEEEVVETEPAKEATEIETKPEEVVSEAAPTEKTEEETVKTPTTEQGLEFFQDLSEEIEGFIAATDIIEEEASTTADKEKEPEQTRVEEVPHLEGQIADIEFLLKEDEIPAPPSFEIAHEFDDFRSNIIWQEEDAKKKLGLAKMAFAAGTYETALSYVEAITNNKETWPFSIEIEGGALIRLRRYSEAMKILAPSLLLEEIQETQKVELRYLLAAAYEGLGNFDNALREIGKIISINPNYKDVKEIYTLMGGKELVYEEPQKVVEESFVINEQVSPTPPEPAIKPVEPAPVETEKELPAKESSEEKPSEEEISPAIAKEIPSSDERKTSEKLPEEILDDEKIEGENIAFL
jgi:tetratricopeptide (TPR) repeat protein